MAKKSSKRTNQKSTSSKINARAFSINLNADKMQYTKVTTRIVSK